jgi:hypothetical protein
LNGKRVVVVAALLIISVNAAEVLTALSVLPLYVAVM